MLGTVTFALKQAFSEEHAVETLGHISLPDYPIGLWENADMWQRRSLR